MVKLKPWHILVGCLGTYYGVQTALVPIGIWQRLSNAEQPQYKCLKVIDDSGISRWSSVHRSELRQYDPFVVVERRFRDVSLGFAMSRGYNALAGYMWGGENYPTPEQLESYSDEKLAESAWLRLRMTTFGDEDKVVKIEPMTVPVGCAIDDTNKNFRVWFPMPHRFTVKNSPAPKDMELLVLQVPAHQAVVLAFRGPPPDDYALLEGKLKLLEICQAEGLCPEGDVQLLQYEPPFVPGFMRRNELMFRVKPVHGL